MFHFCADWSIRMRNAWYTASEGRNQRETRFRSRPKTRPGQLAII